MKAAKTSRKPVLLFVVVLGLLAASEASAFLQCSQCSCEHSCAQPCWDDLNDGVEHNQCSCVQRCAELCYGGVTTPDDRFPDLAKVQEPRERAACSATAEGADTCLAFPALRN